MSAKDQLDRLDERQVTLVLQHLASELLADGTSINAMVDPDAGTAILESFTAAAAAQTQPAIDAPPIDARRNALELALTDPATETLAADLVAEPPDNEQMGGGALLSEHSALMMFVVSYLQTRFKVRISHAGGRTEASVEIEKDAVRPAALGKLVSIARSLLPDGGNQ